MATKRQSVEEPTNSLEQPRVGPSDDAPKIMRDTDIEGLMRQYNLTRPEAEELWNRSDAGNGSASASSVADDLKNGRRVFRPVYEAVPASLSHPLVAIDERARLQELDGLTPSESAGQPLDATRPEAGPYGPHANYPKAEVSAEEIAQQTGLPVELVNGDVS